MPFADEFDLGPMLGEGSYSKVYTGTSRADGKKYAIKILDKTKLSAKDLTGVEGEIAILRAVDHPNILRLINHYDEDNKVFLVTELCEGLFLSMCVCGSNSLLNHTPGGELFNRIIQREYYSERDAQHVLRALASALQLLHSKKIVHRDLKPENILLLNTEEDSPIKVADFGFAKHLSGDMLKTSLGTPSYVAPEVISHKPYNEMVDIWSFGVIAFVLLCGYPPFYADSNPEMFEKIKQGRYEFDSPYWDPVSAEAKDLISKLLVVDPAERLTIEEILLHPFIANTVAENDITPVVSELRGTLERRRLKKAIHTVVAVGRLHSLLKREEEQA